MEDKIKPLNVLSRIEELDMNQKLLRVHNILKEFGLNPYAFFNAIRGIPFYCRDYYKIRRQMGPKSEFKFGTIFPILSQRFKESGTMSGHYFHQDLYVARKIYHNNPNRHIDIGSRTDGFVAHVAVFREIEIIDIRGQNSKVKNIVFRKADLMQLPANLVNAADSVSSLHAIEHFGLGRYGDPIDFDGHIKGLNNIYKILKPGGKFYFSVPLGYQRIEFNAHRVFSVRYLLNILEKQYNINQFSYVDDNGDFHEDVELNKDGINSNYGCYYDSCGIFELTKK
jgi:SAM-dependent methyltransferase